MSIPRKRILDALWPAGLPNRMEVWTILDGARDQRIYGEVDGSYLEKCCLYAGDLPWQLQMAAPYLVQLKGDDRLTRTLIDQGWGRAWGIFFRSEAGLKTLRRHFRGFLRVRDRKGNRLIFRYYDPRVLRAYLPTCTADELRTVFGPVEHYLVESEDGGEIVRYGFDGARIEETRISLEAAVSQP